MHRCCAGVAAAPVMAQETGDRRHAHQTSDPPPRPPGACPRRRSALPTRTRARIATRRMPRRRDWADVDPDCRKDERRRRPARIATPSPMTPAVPTRTRARIASPSIADQSTGPTATVDPGAAADDAPDPACPGASSLSCRTFSSTCSAGRSGCPPAIDRAAWRRSRHDAAVDLSASGGAGTGAAIPVRQQRPSPAATAARPVPAAAAASLPPVVSPRAVSGAFVPDEVLVTIDGGAADAQDIAARFGLQVRSQRLSHPARRRPSCATAFPTAGRSAPCWRSLPPTRGHWRACPTTSTTCSRPARS